MYANRTIIKTLMYQLDCDLITKPLLWNEIKKNPIYHEIISENFLNLKRLNIKLSLTTTRRFRMFCDDMVRKQPLNIGVSYRFQTLLKPCERNLR